MPFQLRITTQDKPILAHFSEEATVRRLFSDAVSNLCAKAHETLLTATFDGGEISVSEFKWNKDKFFPHDFKTIKK